MTPTPNIAYEKIVSDLTAAIKQAKAQTGDLANANEKINKIDQALRGSYEEGGLIARFEDLENNLKHLVKEQIPQILKANETALQAASQAGGELQTCKLHHDGELTTVKSTLAELRKDFDERAASEEKEEKKFGGREWFRENGSALLMDTVKMLIGAGVTALIAYLATH